MASVEPVDGFPILNGSEIIVIVQHASPDLLVVSFDHGRKKFQGILLDSKKG